MGETSAGLLERAAALQRQGAHDQAAAHYREALRHDPQNADALYNLALMACQQGRFEEAIALLHNAVAAAPQRVNAHNLLGMALQRLGRNAEALASFERAIALAPEFAEAHGNRGSVLVELGRTAEALASFDRAVALAPDSMEDWCNRGAAQADLGRHAEAVASFARAMALDPRVPGIFLNRAKSLIALDRFQEALADFDRAIALAPNFAEAYSDRALLLKELGHVQLALDAINRAVILRPQSAEMLTNRGQILTELGRFADGAADYETALKLNPKLGPAYLGRGHLLLELGRHSEAAADIERAIALEPSDHALMSRAFLQLSTGDWRRGWESYEARMVPAIRRFTPLPHPLWDGVRRDGERLVLVTEQGLGDAIQFARFAPVLAAQGLPVTLLTRPALVPLLSTLSGLDAVVGSAAELERDPRPIQWLPLMSVPRVLGTTPDTIPQDIPYLRAEPERVTQWRQRLGPDGFKIGISWRGSITPKRISNLRSVPLSAMAPLAGIERVRLVSLQIGAGAEERDQVGFGKRVEVLGPDLDRDGAFLDTAAVMMGLDLVVSCDTSVIHVAGALGRPVFVALHHFADWRWLLDRDDTPWYPGMRLFRQKVHGDWTSVFEDIAASVRAAMRSAGA